MGESNADVQANSRRRIRLDLGGEGAAEFGPNFAQFDRGRRAIDSAHQLNGSGEPAAAVPLLEEIEHAAGKAEDRETEHTIDHHGPIPGTVASSLLHGPLIQN